MFMAAIPKVPEYTPVHPAGAGAEGLTAEVTACLILRRGDARTAVAIASTEREYFIVNC